MKALKIFGIILASLIVLLLVGPFLVPVPPVEGTRPVSELADADSHFIDVNGLTVHYKQYGTGEPVMILLHGFGASTFSWREVMQPLAEYGTVIAYDRPAFGLTERPMPGDWVGESPYGMDAQVKLVIGLMDALGVEKAILVGNSAGGTVATQTALETPDRVVALVEVDAAIYEGGGAPSWVRPLLNTPQMNHLGPLVSRSLAGKPGQDFLLSAWHDPSKLTPEIQAGYRKPLQMENWDRALWQLTQASGGSDAAERLDEITLPVLVITGDDDRIVPTELSLRLADELPNAQLVVIQDSGHLPHEEQPQDFIKAVVEFINSL